MALHRVTSLMQTVQNRLATGKRSPFENPAAFFTASELSSRANAMNGLLDGMSNAYKTVEAANVGIESLTSLVKNAQSLVTQAQASTATTAKYTGTVQNLTLAFSATVTNGTTLTVSDGATTATITSGGTVTMQQIIDGVNNTANLNVKASLSADGRLIFQAIGTSAITLGGTASAGQKDDFGFVNGPAAAGTVNATRTSLATQYDQIRYQINQLVADAAYNGVNLLNGGSLNVAFNDAGTSGYTIAGAVLDANAMGIAASTNNFQTEKDINDALADMTGALSMLKIQGTSFNTAFSLIETRQTFMKSMMDTLNAGADELTLVDLNAEGAKLLVLQSQQQMLTTALSLAAQSESNVLRMFG
jgi:flagellin